MPQQFMNEQRMIGPGVRAPASGSVPPSETADGGRRHAILTQTVEQDVIPRLLLTRRADQLPPAAREPQAITSADVADLVGLVLAREETRSVAFVESLHAAGFAPETLYLDLLAPTARQLGQMWVDDDCDFTDVTVGLFLLQSALRELASAELEPLPGPSAPRILLVPLPREQHTFGLSMVCDFFRRGGWAAWSGTVDSEDELVGMVRDGWYDVVGFSLPCDEQVEDARAVIRLVRAASLNPGVAVMVGGPGFSADPSLAAAIGADGTAADGRQAVKAAEALLARSANRQCS